MSGRSRFSKPLLAGVLAVAMSMLAACGSSGGASSTGDSSSSASTGKKIVIGYSNPSAANAVLAAFQDSFIAAAERYGWEVKPLDAQLDTTKQAQDIDQFVAQQVDAIYFSPAGAMEPLLPALQRARDAGIKVAAMGAVLNEGDPQGPVQTNVDQSGSTRGAQLIVDDAVKRSGGKGNAIGIGLGFPVPFLMQELENYQKYTAAAAPDIAWLDTIENPTDDIAGSQKVMADALTRFKNDVQIVMTYNDPTAIGASLALKNAGVQGALIYGQNGDSEGVAAVKDGRVTGTYDLLPWRTSLIATSLVNGLLNGKAVPEWVLAKGELYTKENVDQRLDWTEAVDQIKSGQLTCANGGCPEDVAALS